MSRELVCSVLGIAAGPWPPDHYTLIGLRPEQATAPAVEARVQELSTLLRQYQLAYPDEVTDALNRLAQALVCLTDPNQRTAYDSARNQIPPEHKKLAPPPPAPRPPLSLPAAADSVAGARHPARRAIYRRLAIMRQLLRSWLSLRPWLGDPAVKSINRDDAAELIRAVWALRDDAEVFAALSMPAGQPGSQIVAFVRRRRVLRDYLKLNNQERAGLAADWRDGLATLNNELSALRRQVQPRSRLPRAIVRTARFLLNAGLDYLLIVLGIIALAIALWRSRH